jgi:hypothetical protein
MDWSTRIAGRKSGVSGRTTADVARGKILDRAGGGSGSNISRSRSFSTGVAVAFGTMRNGLRWSSARIDDEIVSGGPASRANSSRSVIVTQGKMHSSSSVNIGESQMDSTSSEKRGRSLLLGWMTKVSIGVGSSIEKDRLRGLGMIFSWMIFKEGGGEEVYEA